MSFPVAPITALAIFMHVAFGGCHAGRCADTLCRQVEPNDSCCGHDHHERQESAPPFADGWFQTVDEHTGSPHHHCANGSCSFDRNSTNSNRTLAREVVRAPLTVNAILVTRPAPRFSAPAPLYRGLGPASAADSQRALCCWLL